MDDALSLDPVEVYLQEIARVIPALAPGEERTLVEHVLARAAQAEDAGRRLIETHLAMVVSIARRYPDPGAPVLDLVQAGNEALLTALKTLPAGESFTAHAEAAVTAAIAKAVTP